MTAALSPPPFPPLKDTALFKPLQLGKLTLSHRIVQAPLTRMRCQKEEDGVFVPSDLNVEYYRQRATPGGLQLTEATDICRYASGYPGVPGLFTPSQLAGWQSVTDAVHRRGGYIFSQLWHTGRASPPSFRAGAAPISASALPMRGRWLDGVDCATHPPRPLEVAEIDALVREWAAAARRAVEQAGFDGVEIHGANGYLLDQFLHDNVNVGRADGYGGSVEARCRFPLEVVRACCRAVGAERVGVRLSPYNYFQDTRDSDPDAHWAYLCRRIAELPEAERPVYVHMIEPRFDETLDEPTKLASLSSTPRAQPQTPSLTPFRAILATSKIHFLAAGGYTRDNCLDADADAIVFGRAFVANPDLVRRLRDGLPLNAWDRATFYGAEPPERGYTSYTFWRDGEEEGGGGRGGGDGFGLGDGGMMVGW